MTFLYQNNFRLFILANKILFSGYISNYLFLLLVNPGIPGKENYQDIFIKNYRVWNFIEKLNFEKFKDKLLIKY